MSTQKMYYITLSKNHKKIYKKQLEIDGKSICLGIVCQGKIKSIKEFPFKNVEKCYKCHRESILLKNNRTLRKINRNVKYERKINKELTNEWKEIRTLKY